MKLRSFHFPLHMLTRFFGGHKTHPADDFFVLLDHRNGVKWPYRSEDCELALVAGEEIQLSCPYGRPGDLLWVPETLECGEGELTYALDGAHCADAIDRDQVAELWNRYVRSENGELCHGKVPSVHVPQWASRLTLLLTSSPA